MNISYNWLREISGTAMAPRDLAERLTKVGLAVEGVHDANGDFVIDIDLTSNRPDCLSHLGVAREVSVIENQRVKLPQPAIIKVNQSAQSLTSIEVRESKLCPRYAARIVRGVKIAPSPDWLATRLKVIGQRPINNVADITNYVLHEQGQPLHAFDFAKLAEQRIIVRRAATGEKIKTLDGVERTLDEKMLVIADALRAVAIAGVMGGEATEISNDTRDVLIESAYFDPASVRRTSQLLGLRTEASHRFERGVDYENVLRALERCVALICELAGGAATVDSIDVYPQKLEPKIVSLRARRVEALTNLVVEPAEMNRILSALGFVASSTNDSANEHQAIVFTAPTWRVDVEREEDLVEEIARQIGYDKIPTTLPPSTFAGEYQPNEKRKRAMRRALAAQGYDEAISYSFIDAAHDESFDFVPQLIAAESNQDRFVTLRNSIIEGATRMRPSLLPGLLQAVRHNFNYGTRDVRLFETGRIFAAHEEQGKLPHEREALALAAIGAATEDVHAGNSRELDFYDLKGTLEIAAEALKSPPLNLQAARVKHLREGQSANICLPDKTIIGSIGRINEALAAFYKIRQPLYVAEIDLSRLLEAGEVVATYKPLPRYPSILRDVTFHIARDLTLDEMLGVVGEEEAENFVGVSFVSEYEGANVPANERWVTLRFAYRADDRTLSDDEVNQMHGRIIEAFERKTGARVPEA